MTVPYRLGTFVEDGASQIFVESGGKHLPLDQLLSEQDLRRIPSHRAGDPMVLLEEWDDWSGVIADAVENARDAFDKQGISSIASFGIPTGIPRKLICIGANYHDHIAEMAVPMVPTHPYAFLKPPTTTLMGSGAVVSKPAGAEMFDWEAELAVVIGRRCHDVTVADALSVVAGYANFNDLSARDYILTAPKIGVDWVLHKAFDGSAPIGPYFVPAEFVGDPQTLPIRLSVNDEVKQNSNTSHMVFGVAQIIAHLSKTITLEPGDIIATGTPAGTGFGSNPKQFLQSGDSVEVEIGPLGNLKTTVS